MEDIDIILEIEGKSIICSKEELTRESRYFQVMFSSDFLEKNKSKVELKDVTAKNFCAILEILKTQQLNHTNTNELFPILITANMLQFRMVERKCAEAIAKLMNVDNIFEVWQFAERFNLENLLIKARYMAVTEFETIKNTSGFLQLDSKQLFRLLANKCLVCDSEMSVFEAGVLWIENNENENAESSIYTLFSCLDFGKLSDVDVMEIKNNGLVQKFPNLADVLQHIIDVRGKDDDYCCVYSDAVIKKADILMQTKRRIEDGFPTFVYRSFRKGIHQSVKKGNLDGNNFNSIKTNLDDNYKLDLYTAWGQAVFAYKHSIFFCGGEVCIGTESWLRDMYVFDAITGTYETKSQIPFLRRHFKVVVCEKIAYFIGGYGHYRTNQADKMFYYDCEKNEWSGLILLPDCKDEKVICCNFNKQLFLMVASTKRPRGYFFTQENFKWKPVDLCLNSDISIGNELTIMFSYNNILFVKGKFLTEFSFLNDRFIQSRTQKMEEVEECSLLGYCICNETVYTLYERMFDDKETLLEVFCLTTRTSRMLTLPYKAHYLFPFRHPDICKTEQYVNEYFKSVC